MALPSEPITREEHYLAKIAGQEVELPDHPITREEAYLDEIAKNGGGGGGTVDFDNIENKPTINGKQLVGGQDLAVGNAAMSVTYNAKQNAISIGLTEV